MTEGFGCKLYKEPLSFDFTLNVAKIMSAYKKVIKGHVIYIFTYNVF